MHKAIKLALLRHGGYGAASAAFESWRTRQLRKRISCFLDGKPLPLPDQLILEPTLRCNQRCRMCFQDRSVLAKTPELTVADWIGVLQQSPSVRKVTLIGGEPFLYDGIFELIDYLDARVDIVICTNGTLLGGREWERLIRCRRILSVCISLDGSRDAHDEIRGVPGSFDRATATIKALAPHLPVSVNAVMQQRNVAALDDLVDIAADLGARKVKLELERLFHAEAREDCARPLGLSNDELPLQASSADRDITTAQLVDSVNSAILHGRQRRVFVAPDPTHLLRSPEVFTDPKRRCGVGTVLRCEAFRTATLSPGGALIHCLHIRHALGNVMAEGIASAWNSETTERFRRNMLPGGPTAICTACPYLKL